VTVFKEAAPRQARTDEANTSRFQFCPNVAKLTANSPAPVQANVEGR